MALRASDWTDDDPRRDAIAREMIRERTSRIHELAETLAGDPLMALLIKLETFLDLHASEANLNRTAEKLGDDRMREAPEPSGVDWACESSGRAADVVTACRLIDKRRTGRNSWWQWNLELRTIAGVRTNQFTLREWRSGEQPVDRRVVVAALKLALVEDAHELRLP